MDTNAFIQELYHLVIKHFIDIKKFTVETDAGKSFQTVSYEQMLINLETFIDEVQEVLLICNSQKKEQTQQ